MWPFNKKRNIIPNEFIESVTKDLILSDVVEVKAEEIPPVIDKAKYKDCDIEHMPLTNKYYPRYKGQYIWWYDGSGWRLSRNISMCKNFKSVKECMNFFDIFLEQIGVTSEIIKIS